MHSLLLSLWSTLALGAAGPTSAITVQIDGIQADSGQILASLFHSKNADAFPGKKDLATQRKQALIQEKQATLIFDAPLEPGQYAIAIIHDVNGNQKLDTGFLGIPSEPTGASNDPKPRMGPPLFESAAFEYLGKPLALRIKLQ